MNTLNRASQTAAAILLLTSCATEQGGQVVYSGDAEVGQDAEIPASIPIQNTAFVRMRILADMLYEARLAYDNNRLTSPAGNNAYDMYLQVLEVDEGNAVALEGIAQIARRYIELADAAILQNQYDQASGYLDRSTSLRPEAAELVAARDRLARARENRVTTFALDEAALNARSNAAIAMLGQIARHIQRQEAVFLINARTDEEGRWIYQQMREAVDGYRLRGNIDISATPRIMVTIPQNSQP